MNHWIRVNKRNPCPICRKPDWCMIGEKFILCNRIESPKAQPGGGWLHATDAAPAPIREFRPPPPPPIPGLNVPQLINRWGLETSIAKLEAFAGSLGVTRASLEALDAVWAYDRRAWAFPMRDGAGNQIGIRLRTEDGQKFAVKGSRNGLFIPSIVPHRTLYVCEGPTDTAAALTIGLYAIGRPSCNCGGPELKNAARRLGVRNLVVVADNDEPGRQGAVKIIKDVGLPSVIWTPPAKDLRQFVQAGGTRQLIENELRHLIPIRYAP